MRLRALFERHTSGVSAKELVNALASVSQSHAYRMIGGTQRWTYEAAYDLCRWIVQEEVRRFGNRAQVHNSNLPRWQEIFNSIETGWWNPVGEYHLNNGVWFPKNHQAEAFNRELIVYERGAPSVITLMRHIDPVMLEDELADLEFERMFNISVPNQKRCLRELRHFRRLRRKRILTSDPYGPAIREFLMPESILRQMARSQWDDGTGDPLSFGNTIESWIEWVRQGLITITVAKVDPWTWSPSALDKDFRFAVTITGRFSYECAWFSGPTLSWQIAGLVSKDILAGANIFRSRRCHGSDPKSTCNFLKQFIPSR